MKEIDPFAVADNIINSVYPNWGKRIPNKGTLRGAIAKKINEQADRIKELEATLKEEEAAGDQLNQLFNTARRTNFELREQIKQLEAEVERYKMLAEDRKDDAEVLDEAIDDIIELKEHLHSAEFKLQEIDNEIRVASPTMSGEHNYRITLDGAKRIKKAIQEYFQNKETK